MALSQTDVIRTGAFLARTVYGGDDLPAAYRGALTGAADPLNYDDDYRGYIAGQSPAGENWRVLSEDELGADNFSGPFDGSFSSGGLFLSANDDGNAGEVLIVEAVIDGEKTLFIVFRGSDGEDAFTEAQTFTKQGVTDYYLRTRPVIEAAAQYAAANGIENVVVAGHSLGGTMVDVFALADSDLFPGMEVYLVSLASAGVVPDLSDNAALLDLDLSNSVLGPGGEIAELGLPDAVTAYYAINHTEDRVYYSLPASASGMTPNFVLYDNVHFPGATEVELPNIDNTDVDYDSGPGTEYGFGAEHNISLYWSNIDALTRDPLYAFFTGQALIMGVNAYATATQDYNGTPFAAFLSFTGGPGAEIDRFGQALEGTGGADYILGLAGADQIRGMDGDDLLSGGAGDDDIYGDLGNDRLDGGDGDDFLSGSGGGDTIDGGDGADLILAQNGADMVNGGNDNDTIVGLNGEDRIKGDAGNDEINSGTGSDTVDGGEGNDSITGLNGFDVLSGGDGDDTIEGGNGEDTLNGDGGDDSIDGGFSNDTIDGGEGADYLDGFNGSDVISGGDGDDTIIGYNGADTLSGDAGHDSIEGNAAFDSIEGGTGNDTLRGDNGHDTVSGGIGADLVFGDNGNDLLDGGPGADTIEGGRGTDALTGGGGPDTFVFDSDIFTGHDTVADFENGLDMIEIAGAAEFSDLTIDQSGPDTVVTWATGSVTLTGETGLIDEDDFLFT